MTTATIRRANTQQTVERRERIQGERSERYKTDEGVKADRFGKDQSCSA
jgi:hypothetical protein